MSRVVQCPECGRDLSFFDGPVSGEYVCCSHCDAQLEVIDSRTLELDWAYKPPVFRDDWQDLNVFLGANRVEDVDWEDDIDLDRVDAWEDEGENERRVRDAVR